MQAHKETSTPYYDYFMQPSGGGSGTVSVGGLARFHNRIGRVYRQNPFYQKGYGYLGGQGSKFGGGIGSALASIWRFAFPYLKKGAQALGTAAADVASNVVSDVSEGKDIKESALEHVKSKGVELLKEVPSNIKHILKKNAQQAENSVTPTPDLVAPTPSKFRQIPRKKRPVPVSKKTSYSAKRRKKYPALKHLQ